MLHLKAGSNIGNVRAPQRAVVKERIFLDSANLEHGCNRHIAEGTAHEIKKRIREGVKQAVLDTLAPKEIKYDYVAVTEAFAELGDGLPLVTIDLRPGRDARCKKALSDAIATILKVERKCLSGEGALALQGRILRSKHRPRRDGWGFLPLQWMDRPVGTPLDDTACQISHFDREATFALDSFRYKT